MSSAQISELESGVKDKYLESNLFHYTKSNQKQEKFLHTQNQDQADMQLTPESSDDDDCKNIDLEDYNNLIIQTSTNNQVVEKKL
jgi:hypothetical protein